MQRLIGAIESMAEKKIPLPLLLMQQIYIIKPIADNKHE
jgi:hypothetical protein